MIIRYDDALKELKPKVKETAIVAGCIKALFILGCYAWRNNSGGFYDKTNRFVRFGKTGSADIIGVMPSGRMICVEAKVLGNVQTLKQRLFQQEIESKGGLYLLVHSVDELMQKYKEA